MLDATITSPTPHYLISHRVKMIRIKIIIVDCWNNIRHSLLQI